MNQTRLGSLIEAFVNILIGFGINFCANLIVLPYFGFDVKPAEAFGIGLIFTAISIARSYVIRRWFNARLHAAAMSLASRTHGKEDEIITDCRLVEAADINAGCQASGCNYPQGECLGYCASK